MAPQTLINSTKDMTREEILETLDEVITHFNKAVDQLQHATQALANLGRSNGELLRTLSEVKAAVGAYSTKFSNAELVIEIRTMQRICSKYDDLLTQQALGGAR